MPTAPPELADTALSGAPLGVAARVVAALTPRAPAGLRLFAPATHAGDALQVAVAYAGTRRDARLLRLPERALVVTVDLERGAVRVEPAWSDAPPLPLPPSLSTAPDEPEGRAAEAVVIELGGPSPDGWAPGWFIVTALAGDLVSERRHVLVHGERAREPAAPEARAAVAPGVGEAPAVAGDMGLALRSDGAALLGRGASCFVRGAARISSRYARATPEGAAVPVTLVAAPARGGDPLVHALLAPCDGAPGVTSARFAVDLLAFPAMRREGTFFVYAFAGDAMAGPCLVSMLPPVTEGDDVAAGETL